MEAVKDLNSSVISLENELARFQRNCEAMAKYQANVVELTKLLSANLQRSSSSPSSSSLSTFSSSSSSAYSGSSLT